MSNVTAHEIETLHKKYPNHVCVLVKASGRASDLPPLDKHKYLVPKDLTVGSFIYIIRKRMTLPPEKALFIFVDNTLPTSSATLAELYATHGKDGFLRVTYAGESTFGVSLIFKLPTEYMN